MVVEIFIHSSYLISCFSLLAKDITCIKPCFRTEARKVVLKPYREVKGVLYKSSISFFGFSSLVRVSKACIQKGYIVKSILCQTSYIKSRTDFSFYFYISCFGSHISKVKPCASSKFYLCVSSCYRKGCKRYGHEYFFHFIGVFLVF